MQLAHRKFHLGVFGESGTGKTTAALRFVTNARGCKCCAPRTLPKVFLFDDEGEFETVLGIHPARTPNDLDNAVSTGWICFDPHTMFPGDLERAFEFFCAYALRVSERLPGRKFFVVDELGGKISGSSIPKPFRIIFQTGRRYGIDCVIIGQQPNELHNTVRNQLSEMICFRLTDDNALAFPVQKFGFKAEELQKLPDREFIARNRFGAESRG